jgi:TetR/AcrR family transcriptional regulator, lmrAB and yxaGH operons repressor
VPRPDQSRDRIIGAAASLLRQRGYAATSTTDVLGVAGATTGSLYHHFPGGKEDLAVAALGISTDVVHDALQAALDSAPSTAAALTAWIARLASALDADPRNGCPIAPTALEAVHASERLRAAAATAFQRWAATIAAGLVTEGWPPQQARPTAIAVLSLIEGALMLSRTAGDTEALTAAADQIEHLLRR